MVIMQKYIIFSVSLCTNVQMPDIYPAFHNDKISTCQHSLVCARSPLHIDVKLRAKHYIAQRDFSDMKEYFSIKRKKKLSLNGYEKAKKLTLIINFTFVLILNLIFIFIYFWLHFYPNLYVSIFFSYYCIGLSYNAE